MTYFYRRARKVHLHTVRGWSKRSPNVAGKALTHYQMVWVVAATAPNIWAVAAKISLMANIFPRFNCQPWG